MDFNPQGLAQAQVPVGPSQGRLASVPRVLRDGPLRAIPPPEATVQHLSSRFTTALQQAGKRYIPRGARRDAKPWALHSEVVSAVEERRAARRAVTAEDPASKTRWIDAKKRAAEVEARISRESFREFVTTELNRPSSVGRVSRMLKKWEGAGDDEHRDGEALRIGDRLLVSAEARANAFAHQYATVSRQVRNPNLYRAARKRLSQLNRHTCAECRNGRTGCCSDFTEEELAQAIQKTQLRKSPGPDDITSEMLKHLGPVARSALLHLINQSWKSGVVPQE